MDLDWPYSVLRCPGCDGEVDVDLHCSRDAAHRFVARDDGVLDFLDDGTRSARAAEVTEFYRRFPFPGYSPTDDATSLLERSRRSTFLASLDASLPADALILDAGCGTGQLAAFLALAGPRRRVVGVDACDASLAAAAQFKRRVGIENLAHVRGDLFHLPLVKGGFDFVISRGVVHHTEDPSGATRHVADRVAARGTLLLGFYENIARIPHRLRRGLFRVTGRPVRILDPVLRRRDSTEEKKQIWIEDQYRHPLERMLPLPGVLRELEGQGFEFVRSVPPGVSAEAMLRPTPRPGVVGWFLRRAGMALGGWNDPDAGLVCVVVRRAAG